MRENHDYLKAPESTDPLYRVRADILMLMLKGAGYAMAFCLALWLVLGLITAIGKLLPDESREADDPSPWSYNMVDPANMPDHRVL